MPRALAAAFLVAMTAAPMFGQTPQPFPGVRPGERPPPSQPAPGSRQGNTASQSAAAQAPAPAPDPNAPTSAVVGFPIYPAAQFLGSYDAGKMQRYYLFGVLAPYAEVVKYYQGVLKDRGDEVFRLPPTHMFEQRFREETMAFPPGVTVKDWTSGGSAGYPNPRLGAQPARFPTVVMIVPPPPAAPAPAR